MNRRTFLFSPLLLAAPLATSPREIKSIRVSGKGIAGVTLSYGGFVAPKRMKLVQVPNVLTGEKTWYWERA